MAVVTDLHVSGPNGLGGDIEIAAGACEALIKIAEAIIREDLGPVEFRVVWSDEEAVDEVQLNLAAFRELVRQNSFEGRVSYVLAS